MEQLTYIKEKLQVTGFPALILPFQTFSLGSYELIASTTVLSLLMAVISGSPLPIYLLNGVCLPLLFSYHGTHIHNYW